MAPQNSLSAQQQREFVRVDDYLPFSWRRTSDAEIAEATAYFEKHRQFPPRPENINALLSSLDISERLKSLERNDPNLAKILAKMDLKLNLLIRLFHPSDQDQPLTPQKLNLSGSGLAFWVDEHDLRDGDPLEMRVALTNDALASIECFGRVIRVFDNDEDGFDRIACKFEPILNQDRENLIQHIFKRQAEILRTQRKG